MGQILHGSAKTTHVVRAAIQRSKASIKELAGRYDLNPKTVTKWKKRAFVHDAPMGPKAGKLKKSANSHIGSQIRRGPPIEASDRPAYQGAISPPIPSL